MDSPPFGRGVSTLLNKSDDEADFDLEDVPKQETLELSIEKLFPNPDQPRRHFAEDSLDELAMSISRKGILQPILVRPHPFKSDSYEIVAGERRWQAAQKAGLFSVPIIIKDLSDADTLEIALIENIHRQDLNPIEEATGYKQLIEEFDYTQEALAEVVSRSRSHIANLMRLLSLPTAVKSLLISKEISNGHARALVGYDKAEFLAQLIVERRLSVRQTEKLTQLLQMNPDMRLEDALQNNTKSQAGNSQDRSFPPATQHMDPNITVLQQQLAEKIGLKVIIKPGKKSQTGSVTIRYNNLMDFDRLRQVLEQIS